MFVSALNDRQSFSMKVRDASSTSDDAWRNVWGKEAAAVNPLAAVNHERNSQILTAIRTNDWSAYHTFQAKQHPAWYDNVNGQFKQNKMYYGNLIDVQNRSLKEAIQSGDEAESAKRKARLDELISDFKNAPGEVPHVITFITDPALATAHGIAKPTNDWYNSPYNNALASSQGRFKEQDWHENPYFVDHPKELIFAMEAVQDFRPEIAFAAAKINQGAYERSAASTSFAVTGANSLAQTVIDETVKEAEQQMMTRNEEQIIRQSAVAESSLGKLFTTQGTHVASQFSPATIINQLVGQKGQTGVRTVQDILLDQLSRNAEQRKHQLV